VWRLRKSDGTGGAELGEDSKPTLWEVGTHACGWSRAKFEKKKKKKDGAKKRSDAQHNTAPMITNPLHLDPCKMQQARAIVNL
jgi:hypothetical protein